MKEEIKRLIKNYLTELDNRIAELDRIPYEHFPDDYAEARYMLFQKLSETVGVLSQLIPRLDEGIDAFDDKHTEANARIIAGRLDLFLINDCKVVSSADIIEETLSQEKLIFISHKSDDKKYADALRNFIVELGVHNNQLIYTSHPLHKIPMDANIYEYLRKNINGNVFMIILWSNKYLESPACLNEMGAAWVVQSDYTNIYVPDFHFGNPKYHECAVDTSKMGAVLTGDEHCKQSMIELKDKIIQMFDLPNDERKTAFLIDRFINEITKEDEDA